MAGASGLVGFAALRHFSSLTDCEITAISRRTPHETRGVRFLSVDLTDDATCAGSLPGEVAGTTHLIYAALHWHASWRDEDLIAPNVRMFRNLLDAVLASSPGLRHVTALEGGKSYGVHVRPMPIPAREGRDDAREQPMFYWPQQDYLRAKQAGREWHWTIFRPAIIVGESFGSAMNPIPALGAYAALLKEEGKPLLYPGGKSNIVESTDADLLARAIAWAGRFPCRPEPDLQRHQRRCLSVGAHLARDRRRAGHGAGRPATGRQPIQLATEMPKRSAEWDRIRARYGLRSPELERFVGLSFQFLDSLLGYSDPTRLNPAVSSPIKLRQAGFHEVLDTEEVFVKWFRTFQEKRFLPPP